MTNRSGRSERSAVRKEAKALKKGARGAGRGSALRKVAGAGAAHRKLQSLILLVVTAGSVATALLAAQLLAGVDASFDQAFARQNGSELTVRTEAPRASGASGTDATGAAAAAAAAVHVNGVTAAAGPFPTLEVSTYTSSGATNPPAGFPLPPLSLVGRSSPGGPVDDVQLDSGHWPSSADQIVVEDGSSLAGSVSIGSRVTLGGSPGAPGLTVVGFANSVSQTADAWVLPQEIAVLTPAGSAPGYETLYRFAAATTDAQMNADAHAVASALPAGSIVDSQSWLVLRSAAATGGLAIMPPFLAVFGVLGVLLAVITLASSVNASIASSLRRIGILKALGATPAQVMRAYSMQALIPCVIGVAVGTAAGAYGAASLLDSTGEALDTGAAPPALWPELVVPFAALCLVLGTALFAAGRAGRMPVLAALDAGRAAGPRRGLRAQRILSRSRLPRPVGLGLAAPFGRPGRASALIFSMAMGVLAVTMSVGVASSLGRAGQDVRMGGSQGKGIEVMVGGSQESGAPTASQSAHVVAAVAAQRGTEAYYSDTSVRLPVAGLSQNADVLEYTGDASWSHYPLISGRWLGGDGQAVVPTHLMRAMDLRLGSTITVTNGGVRFPLTVVGEVFDTQSSGMVVLTDWSNFASVQPAIPIGSLDVELAAGTDQTSYLASLNRALEPYDATAAPPVQGQNKLQLVMGTLSVMLTLMLLGVAALGVVGSVVLDTRERVHDIGVYKALGMTPSQTTGMVLTSVLAQGVPAGLIGVPLGLLAHALVMPLMGDAVQLTLPPDVLHVYGAAELALFAAGGVAVSLPAALGPASWAGRIRTASALRTE